MATPDELERAVDRLEKAMKIADQYAAGVWFGEGNDGFVSFATILAILSERAELLATVERLETALIQKADEGMLVLETLAALSPNHAHRHVKEGLAMARQARAALTTGEATNAGERG